MIATISTILEDFGFRPTNELNDLLNALPISAFAGAKAYRSNNSTVVVFPDGDFDINSVYYGNGPEELEAKLTLQGDLN